MNLILLKVQTKQKNIISFLGQLKGVLCSDDFDIDNDLTLISKPKLGADNKYSTPFTLVDLDYDTSDVAQRLKELTVNEYSETLIDRDNVDPLELFVFGKYINGTLVYIKLKIKEKERRHVLCVSFHYAKEIMTFPYA